MKIVTLTLNPAFDLHCFVKDFRQNCENFADDCETEIGGKGVNIARSLTENGVEQTAVVALGEENRKVFEAGLRKERIAFIGVSVSGRIRENITIHAENEKETRLSFSGFSADGGLLRRMEELLASLTAGDAVTLTGSFPKGLKTEDVKAFCKSLTARGIRLAVDSRSFSLADLTEVKPWLIKPNEEEISEYLHRRIQTFEEAEEVAEELHRRGIENVMITLGARGAVLGCSEGVYRVSAPQIKAISTIGAGDASIGGFLAATKEGKNALDCLRLAVAFGSAACLSSGTKPPAKKDVARMMNRILQDGERA